ncbi:MAG: RtcB family protein [Armatimonadota bacterium]|nr:RtcB family protein [Armatimonadota bacterium]
MADWSKWLQKIDDYRWLIPRSYKSGMRTDGLVYASEKMIKDITRDESLEQVANVAFLPGIQGKSLAMPDIHWGYGFPIGGVAATSADDGVVSPGGVGFDINCGVRLLRTDLMIEDVRNRMDSLVEQLFRDVPAGVGSEGRIRVNEAELAQVMTKGARWMIEQGIGWKEDLDHTEQAGCIEGATPEHVSNRAVKRGIPQLGTLGSGNHFLEIQVVDEVYDDATAAVFGIHGTGQITVMIHTGSRGFGHQVCDDSLEVMQGAVKRYGIDLPDRQLACAPVKSPEGQAYLGAMAAAANYAWANRQAIAHWVREAFERVMGGGAHKLGMRQIYDVAHNIAKIEEHEVDGRKMTLCVHRKGATRSFGPGNPAVPAAYRKVGQPVLVPGDMGRYSFLLAGAEQSMKEAFGSCCHGAGRMLSRAAAMKRARWEEVVSDLHAKGIVVKAQSKGALPEEASYAYKDVSDVVDAVAGAGLARRIAKMRPLGVVKG